MSPAAESSMLLDAKKAQLIEVEVIRGWRKSSINFDVAIPVAKIQRIDSFDCCTESDSAQT
jgi:hypothetical protein